MSKHLRNMTIEELNALPTKGLFEADVYVVGTDTLPEGFDVSKYKIGDTINVPKATKCFVACFHELDPVFWGDSDGHTWRPVWDGEQWCKQTAW